MIIFDLDGTLALIEHRRHFVEGAKKDWPAFFRACVDDAPNRPVIRIFNALRNTRADHIEIWSGRSGLVADQTLEWLNRHTSGFFCSYQYEWTWPTGGRVLGNTPVYMRRNGDHTPDDNLKEGWLDRALAAGFRPNEITVFDDRKKVVDMWRRRGVTCLQVAEGNF